MCIDVDGTVTETPQNFTGYSKVEMIFRDPQGLKKTYEAALELGVVIGNFNRFHELTIQAKP